MDESGTKETMISNLPLLFANGYPTSLDKITEKQLENFIPFMVQCSYGKINIPNQETVEPEWWPEDVVFEKPFGKPSKFQGVSFQNILSLFWDMCLFLLSSSLTFIASKTTGQDWLVNF